MPFYKLPSPGLEPAAPRQPHKDAAMGRRAGAGSALPVRRPASSRRQLAAGLLRLFLRAAAVRAAASGRLVEEQEQRQLRLLRLSAPASFHGR